jgi:hypothetical protein
MAITKTTIHIMTNDRMTDALRYVRPAVRIRDLNLETSFMSPQLPDYTEIEEEW